MRWLSGRSGPRWLWLESGALPRFERDAGRAGGGISDVFRLCIGGGTMDVWREELRVETKFGLGVEEALR